ncbi:hypothetical protein DFP73DRAFT_557396 [Morchella snyderi]|nr:hypothetical protein DFP73DRAFT_557396 [Morchella snyderi]
MPICNVTNLSPVRVHVLGFNGGEKRFFVFLFIYFLGFIGTYRSVWVLREGLLILLIPGAWTGWLAGVCL